MSLLKNNGLIFFLIDWSNQNKPILGICLECNLVQNLMNLKNLMVSILMKGNNTFKWELSYGWNNNEIIEDNLFEQGDDKYLF